MEGILNADTLAIIKTECEKIEKEPGFGKVLISIEHGTVRIIQPTPTIMVKDLTSCHKK